MIKFKLIVLVFSILIISCNNNVEKNKNDTNTLSINIPKDKNEISCHCFDGIGSNKGDTVIIAMAFSNGESVSVCGFVDKEMEGLTSSEFNVFECKTGRSLTVYDATQICRIVEKRDTMIIKELKYLPTGKNWAWNLIQIGEQIITTKEGSIFCSEHQPKLENFFIDNNDAIIFLNTLKQGKGHSSEWEYEIGKLEALALLGNKEASTILENYEEFTGQETDGAIAETWKDALATVKWITK